MASDTKGGIKCLRGYNIIVIYINGILQVLDRFKCCCCWSCCCCCSIWQGCRQPDKTSLTSSSSDQYGTHSSVIKGQNGKDSGVFVLLRFVEFIHFVNCYIRGYSIGYLTRNSGKFKSRRQLKQKVTVVWGWPSARSCCLASLIAEYSLPVTTIHSSQFEEFRDTQAFDTIPNQWHSTAVLNGTELK